MQGMHGQDRDATAACGSAFEANGAEKIRTFAYLRCVRVVERSWWRQAICHHYWAKALRPIYGHPDDPLDREWICTNCGARLVYWRCEAPAGRIDPSLYAYTGEEKSMRKLEVGDVFRIAAERCASPIGTKGLLVVEGETFVVEHTHLGGGGQQLEMSGHYSPYPNGHHVTARKLAPDGTYDAAGLAIDFYQDGCFINSVALEDAEIVGKMAMTFVKAGG